MGGRKRGGGKRRSRRRTEPVSLTVWGATRRSCSGHRFLPGGSRGHSCLPWPQLQMIGAETGTSQAMNTLLALRSRSSSSRDVPLDHSFTVERVLPGIPAARLTSPPLHTPLTHASRPSRRSPWACRAPASCRSMLLAPPPVISSQISSSSTLHASALLSSASPPPSQL